MKIRDITIALIVIILWGLNFIVIKIGLRDVPPLLLGSLRFIAAALPAIFFVPRPPMAWGWLIALGLTLNVGQFALLFGSMNVGMPAGLASLLLQAQAFFTLLGAVIFLRESWGWNHILGLAIAASGMLVIGFHQDGTVTGAGLWLVLGASCCWGIGNVIMRKVSQGVPSYPMISLVVWASAVAILPLMLLSIYFEGIASWETVWQSPTWSAVASVIYLAYFATIGGYSLWGKLLARLPAATVSPLALLVPVVGIGSGSLLLGEVLSYWQVGGSLLVMVGLIIHVFKGFTIEKRETRRKYAPENPA